MVANAKRGGNSSPAIFMKLGAALSGVALGVVSCLACYDPVPVYADFGDISSSADYIMSASGSEVESFSSSPVPAWILLLNAFEQFYQETDRDLASEGVRFSELSGYYLDAYGEKRFCTLVILDSFSNPSISTARDLPIVLGSDFTVSLNVPAGASAYCSWDAVSVPARYDIRCSSSCVLSCDSSQYLYGTREPDSVGIQARSPFTNVDVYLDNTMLRTRFKAWATNSNTSPIFRSSDYTAYSLPPSDSMTFADLASYINGDFRDYVVEYYPQYIYLLPEPPQPDSQYATDDIVPGIPKDWTIINPELPTSPHLDLTIPEGDFQAIDPGDTFTGFASGVGFWWSMVNEILTTFHIKTLALALLAVAVAIFALYKIGG